MAENEIAKEIVDAAYYVHKRLGLGLLESVYEIILAYELKKRGVKVERQVPVAIIFDGIKFDEGFKADLIIEDKVIVELIRDGIPSLRNIACQAVFVGSFSFLFMMPTYWLTRFFDNPVVRTINSISGICS
ncbi:MAG TPA: GxxExxY protein [Proteobacteria bacterium]|nr:GxxExxY protein [Pseudomonadota bacterium]